MKYYYDRERRSLVEYKKGDQVFLDGTNLPVNMPNRKLGQKQFGPFKVEDKVGRAAYKLKLPATWKLKHPVLHESQLSPYTVTSKIVSMFCTFWMFDV